ncbi:MAG: hypothetical protein ACUVTD_04475 [Nitrososphaerales archaeon]
MDKLEYAKRLKELAKPFVELGIYDSTEKFLEDIVKNFSIEKIKNYKRIIDTYEKKYGKL